MKFGQIIVGKVPLGDKVPDRELAEVRVYTGRPSPKDPASYAPHMRQSQVWLDAGVNVIPRSLRYPDSWPVQKPYEKGIDVALAVDVVTMAIDGAYDVGVVASVDTDLVPALEFVYEKTNARIEMTAWCAEGQKWSSPVRGVWCHRLTRTDYDSVADHRDYNIGRT
jgi:hypothetical protein